MKSVVYLFKLILIFYFLYSCTKESDNIPPTIHLISPSENDTLQDSNKEYLIRFVADDNVDLKTEHLSIFDENNTVLSSENRNISGNSYTYSNTFAFGGTPNRIKKLFLKIQIIDNENNKTEKSISFFIRT